MDEAELKAGDIAGPICVAVAGGDPTTVLCGTQDKSFKFAACGDASFLA
ncbi:MAG: hypothetical protein HY899_08580 [Deltaproteobacteria bacterium]|nr:hypothetical protein [Deltaproteobacteria bacterium]